MSEPPHPVHRDATAGAGSAREVFLAFLRLGLISFGGPIAHLGYFQREFVARRGWLDDARYAQLLAVCQFLPGPASSQMGFAIGLSRAGWPGALAAFAAFTLPSALLMLAFAGATPWLDTRLGDAVLHGLKLVAVVVVAAGVMAMARTLLTDVARIALALAACALMLASGSAWMQWVGIAAGAMVGAIALRGNCVASTMPLALAHGPRTAAVFGVVFAVGLGAALLATSGAPSLASVASAFYRAGALVFGGGHVVLPLLDESVVATGWVSTDTFLAGYGAAQAVPGPMFTLAAFLGAAIDTGAPPLLGATVALLAIFLPGLLLLAATLPLWNAIASRPRAAGAIAGVNAVVVGLLAAALYDPVWREGVRAWPDAAIVAAAFVLHVSARVPAPWIVAACVLASVALRLPAG